MHKARPARKLCARYGICSLYLFSACRLTLYPAVRTLTGCAYPRNGEAGVAQPVEQLTCNEQVGGSSPFASSLCEHVILTEPLRSVCSDNAGQVAERSKAADCKSAPSGFGGSNPPLPTLRGAALRSGDSPPQRRLARRDRSGSSSDGRASAFQAEGRGFESRLPLQQTRVRTGRLSSVVEHFHGKEGVIGSNPIGGSCNAALRMRIVWRGPRRTHGRSSIGRAAVSKTAGCRFESCRPCPQHSWRPAPQSDIDL